MLVGEKVILEDIDVDNLEKMRQWRNDPQLRQFFRCYKDISVNMQMDWFKERGNNSDSHHVYFQIMSKCSTEEDSTMLKRYFIGCCNLSYIDYRLRSAEFGIYIDPKEHGRGKGYDALKLMFSFGFDELNLHKIWCEVFDNNYSIGLYRKLGFKDEGILRDNYFHNGKYGNSIMMSILEDEWRTIHPRSK